MAVLSFPAVWPVAMPPPNCMHALLVPPAPQHTASPALLLAATLLQIAKAQGAFVATTCSGRNADFVKKLGADRPIDYTQER